MNLLKDKAGVVYYTGLLLLVTGLPLSLFLMSIAQFVLLAAFIMEQNYRQRLQDFLLNPPALVLTGLYLMHVGGLIFTQNFSWASHDLKIKLPLLLMPFLIGTSKPLSKKQFETLLWVFNSAVLLGSLIAVSVLTGIIARPINDIRDIFIFNISHIRFSLLTCLSIFSLSYLLFKNNKIWSSIKKLAASLLCVWFVIFLILAESMTGITILLLTSFVLAVYFLFQKKNIFLRLSVAVIIALGVFSVYHFFQQTYTGLTIVHNEGIENPEPLTALGNPYVHLSWETDRENGYPIWMYLCEDELRSQWNKRSTFSYDSLDMRKQDIRFTLIRFLTSKGLRKDADGVNKLTNEEVHSIEKGIANVNYQDVTSLKSRLQQIFWEYNKFSAGGNPQGHSVMQRMEFWKAAYGIFKDHFFFGTGTGDIVDAYKIQYEKINSHLAPKYRLRAHNQYLTFAATFGIFGLLYFIFALIYPMRALNKTRDFLYVTFLLTAVLSMITEDTLETQAGITFFAFFNCLYLFAKDDAE
jgi:hypothetical protein